MPISKRGNSYSVRYTYEDEHGKSRDKWESFPTKEEATNRKKQIEHELASGTFLIPSSVTAAEFLMDWLPKQCSKHKWAPKTYGSNLSTIQNLIIPYVGSMEMQKLKPYHMENLYTTLSKMPCGSYIEGKKQELTEKQKQRFLSGTTIHEVHRLLGTAFQYAVGWGIFVKSPVPGQAGTQHHFPHPEKHQNRILLPHHLHDLCSERGIEEVAESAGGRREKRPSTLP